jgi:UDP-N-acetylmuramyl tripeptide synthase
VAVAETTSPRTDDASDQKPVSAGGNHNGNGSPRLTPRLFSALVAGKVAGRASRLLGRGGGTSFPGMVARRIAPDFLAQVGGGAAAKTVLISGSNGKTTTARFTVALLRGEDIEVVTNSAGANLVQGVATMVVGAADLRGRVRGGAMVIEVDEGALAGVAQDLAPDVVLATDIFRDQLDRYGELHAVGAVFETVAMRLPASSTWIVNGDDPLVASLAKDRAGPKVTFGFELDHSTDQLSRAADTIRCPRCRADLAYEAVYLSHLGNYRCPSCGFARPPLDVAVMSVKTVAIDRTTLTMRTPWGELQLSIPQGGTHIAYNAAAAVAALVGLGIEPHHAAASLAEVGPAFGRLERIDAAGREIFLAFVKNPTSANTTLAALAVEGQPRHLLIAASNTLVDGEDFAWLWDVDFEAAAPRLVEVTVSGTRADELANRLKYAGVDPERMHVIEDRRAALDAALASTPPQVPLVIMAGYTPTIELREEMRRRRWVGRFWER